MDNQSPAVVCYGEIGVDNIIRVDRLPTPESAVFPSEDTYHIGGAAANTAVWLAAWGIPVRLAGNALGFDENGRRLFEWLIAHPAIDRSFVERHSQVNTPICRVMVTPDGERSFLIFGYPQAPKTPATLEMLDGARFMALDLYGGEERLAAACLAHENGIQTVIGDVITLDHPVLPCTSIATNSAAYIRDSLPGINVVEHARKLQAISKGIIVLTDGAHPVRVLDRDGSVISVQPPAVQAVDATGAGDAFRAGLMAGLLNNMTLADAVRIGAAAGALKVQFVGAASHVPSWDEVSTLAATLEVVA